MKGGFPSFFLGDAEGWGATRTPALQDVFVEQKGEKGKQAPTPPQAASHSIVF